ncbi:MAG: hypothetical protein HY360_07880 [Verrucomicrobia bacterium]|nr:hypothetical protein [Verrucomicrobiota bacterium]
MNLTVVIRKLQSQLKAAEKSAREYDAQANALRNKLESVARIVGQKLPTQGRPAQKAEKESSRGKKRGISAAGLRSIRAAQKKRWAEYHAEHGKKTAGDKKQRSQLSAAGLASIRAAQKKRWTEYHAKHDKKSAGSKKRRSQLSTAGLASIRAAQKKRWAEYRRLKGK